MPLTIVRYSKADDPAIRWGILDNGIHEIPGDFVSTADFLSKGRPLAFDMAGRLTGDGEPLTEATLLSPVTDPCQVLCQGANYRQHMVESGMDPDDKRFNMFFNKSAASISSPQTDIVRPAHVQLLDYEVELGLVIDEPVREPKRITDQDLPRHIAGLVIANDVSARDIQIPQMQFFKGKSYRTFCPVGPVLCLLQPEDFAYLDQLVLQLTVNGEVRQKDSTANLVFKPAETLSELSQVAHLSCGDLILTGTPAGCAMQLPSPLMVRLFGLIPEAKRWPIFIKKQAANGRYLQPGDIVEASIFSDDRTIDLGVQHNKVIAAE